MSASRCTFLDLLERTANVDGKILDDLNNAATGVCDTPKDIPIDLIDSIYEVYSALTLNRKSC